MLCTGRRLRVAAARRVRVFLIRISCLAFSNVGRAKRRAWGREDPDPAEVALYFSSEKTTSYLSTPVTVSLEASAL